MTFRQWRVIDGDGHIIENPAEIVQFLDAPYTGLDTVFSLFPSLDGRVRGRYGFKPTTLQIWRDCLEGTGIDEAVIYPTLGLSIGLIQDLEWAAVLARAYNRWLAETYLAPEPRLRGVALLPSQDVSAAVEELERAAALPGMVCGLLPSVTYFKMPLGDERFEPLWAAAERLGMPIAIHGGPQAGLDLEALPRQIEAHTAAHPFPLMIQFISMIYNGVFHRHPRLHVAYLEAGAGWVPYLMDRMDYEAEARPQEWAFAEPPSAVIRGGRIFVSFEPEERVLPAVIDMLGAGQILYASDFPHELGSGYDAYTEDLEEFTERPDVSDEAKRLILADNALRFYRVPAAVASEGR